MPSARNSKIEIRNKFKAQMFYNFRLVALPVFDDLLRNLFHFVVATLHTGEVVAHDSLALASLIGNRLQTGNRASIAALEPLSALAHAALPGLCLVFLLMGQRNFVALLLGAFVAGVLGVHPWEILHPLLAFPWVTSAINIVYNFWLVALYLILFWQAFSTRDPQLRMQFFLAFVLTWMLLGSLLATLLSSGGPVYYGRMTGLPDPFADLEA